LGKKSALRFHLRRSKEYGLRDEEIYEAMSYILLPCGAPTLIDAVNVLKDVIQKGSLTPNSVFKKWILDEK
jgi:alkylhydroperoxidase/carboxymuconolactone decarboxylase family protein YurZ